MGGFMMVGTEPNMSREFWRDLAAGSFAIGVLMLGSAFLLEHFIWWLGKSYFAVP
jgi:hypothetical protein